MKIYHGSENIIEKPEYGKGKSNNDYGKGFYCTEHYNLACEWAVDINRNGYVNGYDFEINGLSVLNLEANEYTVLNWLAILLENRRFKLDVPIAVEARKYILDTFLPDYEKYDVITGYRADDSYFSFAEAFLNNTISLSQLQRSMTLGQLGIQIVIKSEKAFSCLKFTDYFEVDNKLWYPRKESRDKTARMDYRNMNKMDYVRGDIYVLTILDREITNDELRI